MTRVTLCTDSSSLISPAAAAELGVELVPISVTLDHEPFDGTTDAFYTRMREGAVATTSVPSPGAFVEVYERARGGGATSVLSLHLDRRVSGVSEAAALAARETAIPVHVVSLPTVSYGVGLCVRAAAAALRGGATASTAAAEAERIATTLDNVFVARSAPGGRVPADDEWAILRFAAGEAAMLSTHASVEEATAIMGRRILRGRPGLVAVGHAGAELEAAADGLAHDLVDAVAAVERYRVTPSVGAHTGPDSFGAFWWPASR
ncbi:MAG TPA: DegV family protein [Gaiellaceae bacterium]|nr:DegV family protein [Gaiellaceae bacterium]